jgi:DNA polymerase III delta prime subunit
MFPRYQSLVDNFKQLVSSNRLSHAYFFFGEKKEGIDHKLLFAKSLANFLEKGVFEEPKSVLLDTLFIHREQDGKIGIGDVKKIKSFLFQSPLVSRYRTVILDEVQYLTNEASNALLKIAEEPPPSSLLIFIGEQEESILPTLRSRLQKIYFPLPFSKRNNLSLKIVSQDLLEEEIDLESVLGGLIIDLAKDLEKNFLLLKKILRRLTLSKQFNVNRKLQLRLILFLLKK